MEENIVPPNREGKKLDLEHSLALSTPKEAMLLFNRARTRLLDPAGWKELCGGLSAAFSLTDSQGNPKPPPAQPGDYVRIDLPAPGNQTGNGYDWVKVEGIAETTAASEDGDTIALTLRPASKPAEGNTETAHFFKETATSTFAIKRAGPEVTASYHGRNELPNNETESTVTNIRNSVVAVAAIAGISEGQWGKLIRSFLS